MEPDPQTPTPPPRDLITRLTGLLQAGRDLIVAAIPIFRDIALITAALGALVAAINSWRHTGKLEDLQQVITDTKAVATDTNKTVTDVKTVGKSTELETFKIAVNQLGDPSDVKTLDRLQASTKPSTQP